MLDHKQKNVTAVLVHGAWADGSSWNKVTTELQRRGFQVVAAQIPLTSLSDDVAVLRRVLRDQKGPVVLVGHSYGGAVVTAAGAGDPNVKALVYVAAVVPDQGETVGEVFHRVAPHPKAPQLQPDQDGFLWLKVDAFRSAVAPDASRAADPTSETLSPRTSMVPPAPVLPAAETAPATRVVPVADSITTEPPVRPFAMTVLPASI